MYSTAHPASAQANVAAAGSPGTRSCCHGVVLDEQYHLNYPYGRLVMNLTDSRGALQDAGGPAFHLPQPQRAVARARSDVAAVGGEPHRLHPVGVPLQGTGGPAFHLP